MTQKDVTAMRTGLGLACPILVVPLLGIPFGPSVTVLYALCAMWLAPLAASLIADRRVILVSLVPALVLAVTFTLALNVFNPFTIKPAGIAEVVPLILYRMVSFSIMALLVSGLVNLGRYVHKCWGRARGIG